MGGDVHARRHTGRGGQVTATQRQLQVAALGDFHAVGQGLGQIGKQRRHLRRRAQVLLGGMATRRTGCAEQGALADAAANFLRLPVRGLQEQHGIGRHHRHAVGQGEVQAAVLIDRLAGAPGARQFQIKPVAKQPPPVLQVGARLRRLILKQRPANFAGDARGEGNEPRRLVAQPVTLDLGAAVRLALAIGAGQQPRQLAIAGVMLDQQHQAVGLGGGGGMVHAHTSAPAIGLIPAVWAA